MTIGTNVGLLLFLIFSRGLLPAAISNVPSEMTSVFSPPVVESSYFNKTDNSRNVSIFQLEIIDAIQNEVVNPRPVQVPNESFAQSAPTLHSFSPKSRKKYFLKCVGQANILLFELPFRTAAKLMKIEWCGGLVTD